MLIQQSAELQSYRLAMMNLMEKQFSVNCVPLKNKSL